MAAKTRTKTKTTAERMHSLDALRGIAAFLVVIYHYIGHVKPDKALLLPPPLWRAWEILSSCGALLVQFFFVLSGFIFYKTYRERIASGAVGFREFCVMRFSRLYPLAWLTVLVQIGINLWREIALGGGEFSLYNTLASLLLVDGYWFSSETLSINGPSWSLSVEIMAYLLFFFISRRSSRKNGLLPFALPVFLGILVFNLNLQYPIIHPMFVRVFYGFFIGCLTCELHAWAARDAKRNARLTRVSVLTFLITMGIYYYAPSYIGNMSYLGNNLIVFSVVVFPALLVIALNARSVKRVLNLLPFRWLGELSFSIYLIHWCVLSVIITLNDKALLPSGIISNRLFILAVAALILVLSHVSRYCFEIPVQKFIRDKYRASRRAENA